MLRVHSSFLLFVSSIALTACSHLPSPASFTSVVSDKPMLTKAESAWIGVYTSPEEISGFSGTVLSIEKSYSEGLKHRMTFYSDVFLIHDESAEIIEPEKRGAVLVLGNQIYVAVASGRIKFKQSKPTLSADLDTDLQKYTRLRINGRVVLMRDDAFQAYRRHNRLYDYGILIKVADTADSISELSRAKHESIKVLYEHPAASWQDPFVNGPNTR